ncbi:Hypothetical predicted protein [Scomber scombrus]|uniref:Uncharacterized protein n=1 Tax=Scomber scombrus TaxID=13677 RepID=A0AAV1QC58_SCOSC
MTSSQKHPSAGLGVNGKNQLFGDNLDSILLYKECLRNLRKKMSTLTWMCALWTRCQPPQIRSVAPSLSVFYQ